MTSPTNQQPGIWTVLAELLDIFSDRIAVLEAREDAIADRVARFDGGENSAACKATAKATVARKKAAAKAAKGK